MTQPATSFTLESQAISDRGLNERRPLNEDSFLADSARRSAAQVAGAGSTLQPLPIDGSVVMSTIRKRSRVIGWPRLFVILLLNVSVPKVLF